jgi:hypothetical protein
LFGILPALLAYRQGVGGKKTLAAVAILLFGLILGFEVAQGLGFTHILPDIKYWDQFRE